MTAAPLSTREAAALLRASLDTLAAEAGALQQAQLSWHPSEGAWCINEIVGHLIEAEQRGFAGRIQIILDREHPMLETWDQEAVAQERDDCSRDGHALLREFEALRLASLRLVEQLTPDQLRRSGDHPLVGELGVQELLHEWIFHDRAHLQQVFDNVKTLMWPHMGNCRRFSQPDDPGATRP